MEAPLKILTVYYKHKPGGFCKRIDMKIQAFLEKGWEVHTVSVEPLPYSHQNHIDHILPPVKHETFFFWLYFFTVSPWYILFLTLRLNIDLISAVSPVYACLSLPGRWLKGIPMQTLILSKPRFMTGSRKMDLFLSCVERILEKLGLSGSDLLIANSEGSKAEWSREYGRKAKNIEVLTNNVDEIQFDKKEQRSKLLNEFSLGSDYFVVATASLLEPHKNIESLLSAFAKISRPHTVLLVLGDGKDRERLIRISKNLGIQDRTLFPGWRNDARTLIQGTDLFILPSFREGMPESLLEATTCEVPCLVSAIPENMEVIPNPEQHFPTDNPEVLASKIGRLIEDPEYYRELLSFTFNAKQRYVFDWKSILTQKTRNLLKSL